MDIETDSNAVFNIRQYVSSKRYASRWKDVDGELYIDHVEALLDEIDSLERLLEESQNSGEDRFSDGWREGHREGEQEARGETQEEAFYNGLREGTKGLIAEVQNTIGGLQEILARLL